VKHTLTVWLVNVSGVRNWSNSSWKESEITDEYMTGGIVVVLGKRKKFCCWYEWRNCLYFDVKTIRKWFVQYGNGSLKKN
jgi:hypothetical protein